MDGSNATPKPDTRPLSERTQQLRALWQALPGYVSAFVPRRTAATP